MPKVSIILPIYNVEKYIAKSIESVLAQTYTDFELLVIDDGTPDRSIEVVKTYNDSRIKIFHKENGGLSDARNYGLERAIGDYIYFMDSDDWIEPDLLEDNIAILEEANLDFVVFGYIQDNEDEKGQVVSSAFINPKVKSYVKGEQDLTIDTYHLGLLGYAWNKLYRKTFLDEFQFRFEKGTSLIEDILFNSKVYQNTETIYFNERCYYHYLNRQVMTLMKQFHINSFDLKKRRVYAVDDFLKNWRLDKIVREQLKAEGIILGVRYCIHNLYSFNNQLSEKDSKVYVKNMVNDPLVQESVKFYKVSAKKDILYKLMLRYKCINLIVFLQKQLSNNKENEFKK